MSSEMFWISFILSLVASVALAIFLGNHLIPQAGWRHILEVFFFAAIVSLILLVMLGAFEVTFHIRDFVCHRILKNR